MRPILRPGSHVLRRNRQELQIGLDPQHAVVLPDDTSTRSSLSLLSRSADAREYHDRRTLELLQSSGLVLDGSRLLPLLPAEPEHPAGPAAKKTDDAVTMRHDVASLARSDGDRAADLLAARKKCPVDVVTFADLGNDRLTRTLADLIRQSGLPVRRSTARVSRTMPNHAIGTTRPSRGEVAALIGVGEPQRELLDDWMRLGVPHVLVRLSEGYPIVGPFVFPGRTACLRCIDAHHTDADRSWPLLVAQYAGLSGQKRADGVPEPVDSLLTTVALAWAARDLTSYAEGRRPSTWSSTIRFDPYLASVETRSWLRHPECGCAWM